MGGLRVHDRQAYNIRRLLTAQHIDVRADRRTRFVGVRAIEKAGGMIVSALFSDDNDGYIEDEALLERLAQEKLAAAAKKLDGEGWHWVEAKTVCDHAEIAAYLRVRMVRREPTEQEQSRIQALTAQRQRLREQLDATGEDDEQHDMLAGQLKQCDSELGEISRELFGQHPADKALAGALVTLGPDGKIVIHRDLIRPEDRTKMPALDNAGLLGERTPKSKPVLSERLTRILTAHRAVALQAQLAARPEVALAVVAYAFVKELFYPTNFEAKLAQVSLRQPILPVEAKDGPAWEAKEAKRAALAAQLPSENDADQLLPWLLSQPQAAVLELLAYCVACSLDAVRGDEGPLLAWAGLAQAVGLDMARWWKPTADSYFSHVSKARIGNRGNRSGVGRSRCAAATIEESRGSYCSGSSDAGVALGARMYALLT